VNKVILAGLALILTAAVCYAAEGDAPKATEPVGAVVETAGVIIGKITTVVEESMGGGKGKAQLVLAEEDGKTRIVPIDNTVKVLDSAFNALTLNQLKKGDKVSVKVEKDASGNEKAGSVQVVQ